MELVEAYNRNSVRKSIEKWNKEIAPIEDYQKRMAKTVGWLWPCQDSNGKYGFKDLNGVVKIPCQWKEGWPFREGIAVVIATNNKFGLINKMGNTITPCKWADIIWHFEEGVLAVKNENGLWGFIDKSGREIIPCQWKGIGSFCEGLAPIKDNNGKWGFIDHYGEMIITPQWHDVRHFSNEMAGVSNENGFWGYINIEGRNEVPCKYYKTGYFSNDGLAAVQGRHYSGSIQYPDSYGYVDKRGKPIIPCQYRLADTFEDGKALVLVWDDDLWHVIDAQGRVLETKPRGFSPKLPQFKDNYNRYEYAE